MIPVFILHNIFALISLGALMLGAQWLKQYLKSMINR